ncbi:hypothetical protein ATK36_3163 [Amycolatopsis sulphurea]|uniref:Uncharacterized protein n=1 Tax=Amycolatopsis sulphurea TaxID=76022 RepID=A0A2A9FCD0_9PSEU|nr:hypothetical protein [Amycolatopsis sulphurea]PFG48089.1 hypothetical protein ATK36_3163 [Amycolatopsis sulphurea]
MTALIYVDPEAIRPVIDGVWHMTELSAVPAPGDEIAMLCGVTAPAAFVPPSGPTNHAVPTQCSYCDVEYRRARGWAIRPEHPGLSPRSGRQ